MYLPGLGSSSRQSLARKQTDRSSRGSQRCLQAAGSPASKRAKRVKSSLKPAVPLRNSTPAVPVPASRHGKQSSTVELSPQQMQLFQAARQHQIKKQRLQTLLAKHAHVTKAIAAVTQHLLCRNMQQQQRTAQTMQAHQETQLVLAAILQARAAAMEPDTSSAQYHSISQTP